MFRKGYAFRKTTKNCWEGLSAELSIKYHRMKKWRERKKRKRFRK